jgi:multisubunit Na+/H+ antiporter MnhB subunit
MKGMTVIVKKTTQVLAGIIFLYGAYVIIHGHLTPGGGFAGGVIIAGAFILVTLAYGSDFLNLKKEEAESTATENISILMAILLSIFGLFLSTRIFFLNFLPKGTVGELISAGVLPLYNIFIGIEVASSIFVIFLALVIYKEEESS